MAKRSTMVTRQTTDWKSLAKRTNQNPAALQKANPSIKFLRPGQVVTYRDAGASAPQTATQRMQAAFEARRQQDYVSTMPQQTANNAYAQRYNAIAQAGGTGIYQRPSYSDVGTNMGNYPTQPVIANRNMLPDTQTAVAQRRAQAAYAARLTAQAPAPGAKLSLVNNKPMPGPILPVVDVTPSYDTGGYGGYGRGGGWGGYSQYPDTFSFGSVNWRF